MEYPVVRLEDIVIKNLKNVEYGHINFNLHKMNSQANILGLYGQNGSGKTVLIDALHILKQLLMGQRLSEKLVDYITLGAPAAELNFTFSVVYGDVKMWAYYDVDLIKEMAINNSNTENEQSVKEIIVVDREKLQYKVENPKWSIRKTVIADTKTDSVFVPNNKFNLLFGKSDESITDFLVDKRVTRVESKSFLFSGVFIKRLASRKTIFQGNEEGQYIGMIIDSLVQYGNHDLFVVLTMHSGLNSLNILPLEIIIKNDNIGRIGTITLPLDSSHVLPVVIVDEINNIIKMMNLVLSAIIPDLKIEMSDLGNALLKNGEQGRRVELVSVKGDKKIPLTYESEGIRKIISILSLLIAVYNRPSVTIAIDELDAGIFEYLLGEILRIIAEKGKGQLIFTSHNLRPLETLSKYCIAFTTTNPKNRYVRPTNVKKSNNLRDFYYRDIILGEQAEEIYKPTQNSEISYAFKKAGGYKWQKEK